MPIMQVNLPQDKHNQPFCQHLEQGLQDILAEHGFANPHENTINYHGVISFGWYYVELHSGSNCFLDPESRKTIARAIATYLQEILKVSIECEVRSTQTGESNIVLK